jgi:HNH endonuclease
VTYICVHWLSGDPKGYVDWYPVADFAREVTGVQLVHLVTGPRGGKYHARYRLRVRGRNAKLDYRPFREFNERYTMELGVMDLEFKDNARVSVASVSWDGVRLNEKEIAVSKAAALPEGAEPSKAAGRRETTAEHVTRPAQVAFREELDRTYGACCCISGCSVPFALEAAHLTPFAEDGMDAPQNGLLLRADLHALLDSYQLAIQPQSRRIHFSPEARAWKEYAALHGRARLRSPQAGYEVNAPSTVALASIWEAFTIRLDQGSAP